ncbi:restriction endonuclease subunit S [uncultured Maribacter sp.]|uniref:restriction endonuclease subunit S n=1 Tax=uncultured Maribacter sp. TaxID=431308 RepID=UPI00262A25C9|nr:restriction endonuclease subunit S [uncultured Maribacter sp.]
MEVLTNKYKPFYKFSIPNDWRLGKLSSFGFTYSGLSGKSKEDFGHGKPYVPYKHIFKNAIIEDGQFDLVSVEPNENQSKIENGDLFFTTSSETPEELAMSSVYLGHEKELYLNSFCFGFRATSKDQISTSYLAHLFRSSVGRRIIYKLAQGATRYNISKKNLVKEDFPLPTLSEQKKIASALNSMDEAIYIHENLLSQKEQEKKWLAQNLLSGKKRSKNHIYTNEYHKTKLGVLPVDWDIIYLKDILNPAGTPVTPIKDELYQQIGIRSHKKGIFYKEKVTGASLGKKRVFWIESDCFIVNIVFAWEHAVAKTTDHEKGMIASHRFPMYKPKEGILDLNYLLYYFKSPRGKYLLGLASPGGAGRNKTLGKSEFMKLQIPVPSYEEQIAIAQILSTMDQEIILIKEKINKLREQKKGMIQVLLTGKKRLKID